MPNLPSIDDYMKTCSVTTQEIRKMFNEDHLFCVRQTCMMRIIKCLFFSNHILEWNGYSIKLSPGNLKHLPDCDWNEYSEKISRIRRAFFMVNNTVERSGRIQPKTVQPVYCHSISTYFLFVCFQPVHERKKRVQEVVCCERFIYWWLYLYYERHGFNQTFFGLCVCEFVNLLCVCRNQIVSVPLNQCPMLYVCVRWPKIWWYTAHIRF